MGRTTRKNESYENLLKFHVATELSGLMVRCGKCRHLVFSAAVARCRGCFTGLFVRCTACGGPPAVARSVVHHIAFYGSAHADRLGGRDVHRGLWESYKARRGTVIFDMVDRDSLRLSNPRAMIVR